MIKKIKETLGQIFFSPEAAGSWIHDVEGTIDEDDGLDYEDQYYTGVPAPSILEDDPWFGPTPPLTEKQEEIRAQLEEEKQLIAEEEDKSPSKEVANIHEVMYNVATSNGKTTVQLDPPGCSENFHSGPDGWMSGTGMNQFN